MKTIFLIFVIVALTFTVPMWATVTTVQSKCTGTSVTDFCSSGSTTCAITGLSTVGAGNLGVFVMLHDSGSAVSPVISSSTGETLVHCAACTIAGTTTQHTDMSYVLSMTGGETSFTVTFSVGITGNLCFYEYSTTAGPFAFDNSCTSTLTTVAPTTCALASMTGSNDVKIGGIVWGGSLSGVSAPGADFIASNGNGTADVLNVATLTGIAFTPTSTNTGKSFMAAFKETGGGAVVSGASKIDKYSRYYEE